MHIIAMPAPPSADGCFVLAIVYAVLASGVCWIAIRRRRSIPNSHRFIAWIPASACIGSIAAILAGPLALGEASMEHWIGYIVENAIIRSFLGAGTAAFIASAVLHMTESRIHNSRWSTVAILFATTVCITAFLVIFLQSAYVGFFVVIHVVVLAAVNVIYIRRYIQQPISSGTSSDNLPATTDAALPEP